jgi:hypothetical protein
MGDNIINNGQQSNFSFTTQNGTVNTTITNMSVVPQISTRPNTLPINGQRENNPSFFTPDDYAKYSLSTPDLINALASQPFNDGQSSPSLFFIIKRKTTIIISVFDFQVLKYSTKYSLLIPIIIQIYQ